MKPDTVPLKSATTQAPSLGLVHSAAPVVQRDKMIDTPKVCEIVGVKKSTLYNWLQDPDINFPKPIRYSPRMVRFSEAAVLTWVQNRIAQSANQQAEVQ